MMYFSLEFLGLQYFLPAGASDDEFKEYVRDCFSEAGDIVIKSMMGGYLVYFKGKLIGDVCVDELFMKRTPSSDRLLADSELRYPYEGSKTLMHVFDSFDNKLIELLEKFAWWNKSIEEINKQIPILKSSDLEMVRRELKEKFFKRGKESRREKLHFLFRINEEYLKLRNEI